MLVLSRKNQESVVVGGCEGFERLLKVTVLEIGSNKVRLGFHIEGDVPIHRLEIWERIRAGVPVTPAASEIQSTVTNAAKQGALG